MSPRLTVFIRPTKFDPSIMVISHVDGMAADLDRSRGISGAGNHHGENKDGTMVHWLSAGGTAFDSRIDEIVGITSSGKTVETKPINGFWWMMLENTDPAEQWSLIHGVDKNGKEMGRLGAIGRTARTAP